MIWILALPSIIFGVISLMISLALLFGFYRLVTGVFQRITLYFETRYQPKIIHLETSEHEIKRRFKEIDNREYGYNPQRQDYAPIELFPKKPCLITIEEYGRKLFPNLHLNKLKPENEYSAAKDIFLKMLVTRQLQIESKLWTSEKEKLWAKYPFRPKQMTEIDSFYLEQCRRSLGLETTMTRLAC
jgi:hypothetical protein